jgi:hypothetical protein
MSDHDAPDPIDKAYVQAEAMLDDEAARAARRARVLGAVAGEAGATPIVSARPQRRVSWAAGGWLAAASVAGVSVLVALQLSVPRVVQRPSSPVEAPVAAAPAPRPGPATAPVVEAAPPALPAAPPARVSPSADVAVTPPSPFPAPMSQAAGAPVAAAPPPPPALAIPPSADSVEGLIVTGEAAPSAAAGRASRAESSIAQAPALAVPAARTDRLHAAAAAGRLAELTALLAQGTPVDAPDSEGETALMKAIQARNPAAAALLLRHGASLDRTNRAGVSARDMAASIDDPELNRALGLEP